MDLMAPMARILELILGNASMEWLASRRMDSTATEITGNTQTDTDTNIQTDTDTVPVAPPRHHKATKRVLGAMEESPPPTIDPRPLSSESLTASTLARPIKPPRRARTLHRSCSFTVQQQQQQEMILVD